MGAEIEQVRVRLPRELEDVDLPGLIPEDDGRLRPGLAPHLRARSHALMLNHTGVIHKQPSPAALG